MSATMALVDRLKRHVVGDNFVRRNPFYYERARRLLERLEDQDLDARAAWTREQLARTLASAQRADYGCIVRGGDDIATWPLLDKELLRNRLHAFVTGNDWFSAPAATGGTAGVPLKLVRSLDGIVFEQASIDRLVLKLGLHPRTARTAVLRGDNLQDPRTLIGPDGVSANGGRSRIFCARAVSPGNIDRIADALERFSPQLLYAYPGALEMLCRLLVKHGRTLHIPAVLTSSEVLRPEAWALAQSVLGCRIIDYYGQAERVAFAYAQAPREYRFLAGYAHVEFIPCESPPATPGENDRVYEVIGTALWNNLMPLVRYRTGDLVRLPAAWGEKELLELALGLRTFTGFLGREQEIVVCPQRVRLTGLESLPAEVNHVLRVQVVQESLNALRVCVIPAPGYGEADAANLLGNLRARLPESMQVDIVAVDWLERTPRGKTPLVVHRSPVHDALRRAGVEPVRTH